MAIGIVTPLFDFIKVNMKTFWALQDKYPVLNSPYAVHASNNTGHWFSMSYVIYDFMQDTASCID